MPWTDPATHIYATGEVVTASTLNTFVEANLSFLGKGYGGILWSAGAQAISSGTLTVIAFDTIESDPTSMSTTGASARFTVPTGAGGVYLVSGGVNFASFAAIATGVYCSVGKNGAEARRGTQFNADVAADALQATVTTTIALAAGDYVDLRAYQNSGSSANTSPGQAFVYLCMHLLGPN